nr:MAG: hypothetical protein [Microviridae sp.]
MKKKTLTVETPKYRSQGNYYPLPSDNEHGGGKTMTLPDQAMSVGEILDKFVTGMTLDEMHEAIYSDTDDFNDFDPQIHDLTDYDDIASEVNDILSSNAEKRKALEAENEAKRMKHEEARPNDLADKSEAQ